MVRTARGRKISSTRWLARQLNDPYVAEARRRGYRSRAAFKLLEIDDKYAILKPGSRVVDLGAAPGGWTQVAVERIRLPDKAAAGHRGRVVAIDIDPFDAVEGAVSTRQDLLAADASEKVIDALKGEADIVMSDMAAPTTGHHRTDHLKIMALCEAALALAREVLAPGGVFLAKVFQGGAQAKVLADMKRDFATVRHVKPRASRPESAELYVLATGFRGRNP
ncbi:MAG: RlmE family RNA methyltransferase [Hyphomicrobiales bacterium]